MFFGVLGQVDKNHLRSLKDLNRREYTMLVPLVALIFAFGVFPSLLFNLINASVMSFVEHVSPALR